MRPARRRPQNKFVANISLNAPSYCLALSLFIVLISLLLAIGPDRYLPPNWSERLERRESLLICDAPRRICNVIKPSCHFFISFLFCVIRLCSSEPFVETSTKDHVELILFLVCSAIFLFLASHEHFRKSCTSWEFYAAL